MLHSAKERMLRSFEETRFDTRGGRMACHSTSMCQELVERRLARLEQVAWNGREPETAGGSSGISTFLTPVHPADANESFRGLLDQMIAITRGLFP